MGIPLQPINMAAYRRNPMLNITQIAQGMQNLDVQRERQKALEASAALHHQLAPSQIEASQARANLFEAQAKAAPITAQAALTRAQAPVATYGAIINPLTNELMVYNKFSGEQGIGALHSPLQGVHPAWGGGTAPHLPPSGGVGGGVPQMGVAAAPAAGGGGPQASTATTLRNLMTGGRYTRGGTQTLVRDPQGNITSITSPTRSAQTAQQVSQMGEAAFSNTYPFMSEAVKNFGSSTYGAGLKDLGTIIHQPATDANAKKIAEFLAVDRLKPSIAGDLGRMTTGGTPAERTMAEYATTAFAQLPSGRWARLALMSNPKLAKMVTNYEDTYYPQMEKEIQEARSRSLALQSRVALGRGIQVSPLGQPIPTMSEALHRLTPQNLMGQPLGAQQMGAPPPISMPAFKTRKEAETWFRKLSPSQRAALPGTGGN